MDRDVFPEPAAAMPEIPPRGSAVFRLVSEIPPPVRHATGYEGFVRSLDEQRADAHALARDLPALLRFLAAHPGIPGDSDLLRSAAVFFGNALVVLHPRASWSTLAELEVGTRTRSIPVELAVRMLIEHPERHDEFLQMLQTWDQDDEDDDELERLHDVEEHQQTELHLPEEAFRRPDLREQVYLDDAGQPIPYGDHDRWPDGPPDDAYERLTHQERFAPLQIEVDALVEYLARTCDVRVDQQTAADGDRVFTLTPADGAPMRITSSPTGVMVSAGALYEGCFPPCTCDACNESATTVAADLESALLGIIGGGLREQYPVGRKKWTHVALTTPGGGSSSSAGPLDPPLDTRKQRSELRARLAELPDGRWPAWPHRGGPPA